ncbi:pyruvate dehydrogenase (acetyl-transferring) E1 component subunit alpha [Euzebya tangerina]|uniref:pyruvate dehydrogenase (acetyl-transferring) E1 component subunit alpha n=1 Tax=Euzebya tangerina TaxID=591198 RepID=UPI000E313ADB|nr:pyruvate dehydrogenase (acetyl-transferring) E1 component subunit alpha [Euzebya tangerina]
MSDHPDLAARAAELLPDPLLLQLLSDDGVPATVDGFPAPTSEAMLQLYRTMKLVRAVDRQSILLTRQGQLAVYPSSHGQEAAQVGAVLALREQDWLFPSYRETVAIIARGVPPLESMPLFKGTWHAGWDPHAYRVMPHCTPIATQCVHAVGLAHAATLAGDDVVSMTFCGDGGTSEGDFHEALNFAAVYRAPTVFVVQNNGWAISVPSESQTKAPTLAHKAVGYGMPGVRVDGNDVLAVHAAATQAVARASRGDGPTLIEAMTYRVEAHTTADDDLRYRSEEEVEAWRRRDPIARMEAFLAAAGIADETLFADADDAARAAAAEFRGGMFDAPHGDPLEMFAHVYVDPPSEMIAQRDRLSRELAAS